MTALGQQPTVYINLLERLECEVKQPLVFLPGRRRLPARSGRNRDIQRRRLTELLGKPSSRETSKGIADSRQKLVDMPPLDMPP